MKRYIAICLILMFCVSAKDQRTADDESIVLKSEHDIDANEKFKQAQDLVDRGCTYLKSHRVAESLDAFLNNKVFVVGDMQLFVLDDKGFFYCDSPFNMRVWENIRRTRNRHNILSGDYIIKHATEKGVWLELEWGGGYQSLFVKKVQKGKKSFIVCTGWYPITGEMEVKNLVKNTIAYIDVHGKQNALQEISNKRGKFIVGDLYVFAYDLNGYCLAHGHDSELIGQNMISLKDANGLSIIQKFIDIVKTSAFGWLGYVWKNAPKKSYIQRVRDTDGDFFVGAGYYPSSIKDEVILFVNKAVKTFNQDGRKKAAEQFTFEANKKFRFGDSAILMLDFAGNVLASGDSPNMVGVNLFDFMASHEYQYIKDMITLAKNGGGWMKYVQRGREIFVYVVKTQDHQGEYVLVSGFYPYNERNYIEGLVDRGIEHIVNNKFSQALCDFMNSGPFLEGSYFLTIFTMKGDCLVHGQYHDMIWRNFATYKDEKGVNVLDLMKEKIKDNGGWISYTSRNAEKMVYVKKVSKNDNDYIICSGFYV